MQNDTPLLFQFGSFCPVCLGQLDFEHFERHVLAEVGGVDLNLLVAARVSHLYMNNSVQ